jgi:hypothetical protein
MVWVVRDVTLQDCADLATRLRSEDTKEVLASRPGVSLTDSLYECIEVSYKSYAVMEDGIGCIAIFGVRKSDRGGIPWFLTSDLLIEKSSRKFIRDSKMYFREVTEDFEFSFNYVSVTNLKAHHWLKWLGFTLDTSQTFSLNGVTFYPFTYTRNNHV